ncbi:methylamine dehydrogenase accessory protein MauD [Sphingomonas profundi]|uniref:methylamine dehydrogenase accessory protein MauD n=1 Tax=Alterirhizorhabdus profundi TaxID=2681549 RepID=UPI0012E7B289|nr:methylamine dehydrogenase accessory protein MauD [Sphingomonas profundi]
MLIASTFLLWIVVALLTIAVLALARQIGVLHERIAPMGALVTGGGPAAGDLAPHVHATTIDGRPLAIGPGQMGPRRTLLMFVAPSCPVCRKVIPIAKGVASAEGIDLVFIGDGDAAEQAAMVDRYKLSGYPFANSPAVGLAFHVGKLPYGVLIRSDGVIAAKGLVSSREHVESLVNADDKGFASAQAYLRSVDTAAA